MKSTETVEQIENLTGESRARHVAEYIADYGLPESVPDTIKDYFVEGVVLWSKTKSAVGLGISLYGAVKSLRTLFAGPLAWLLQFVGDLVEDKGKELLSYYGSTVLTTLMGGRRIGSHSLLAKDGGHELFYKRLQAFSPFRAEKARSAGGA